MSRIIRVGLLTSVLLLGIGLLIYRFLPFDASTVGTSTPDRKEALGPSVVRESKTESMQAASEVARLTKNAAPALRQVARVAPSPGVERLKASRDWKRFLDEVDRASDLPARERLFAKAVVLSTCSNSGGAGFDLSSQPVELSEEMLAKYYPDPIRRASVVESLSRHISRVCSGFGNLITTRREIAEAFQAAADAGDVRAKAWLVGEWMAETSRRKAVATGGGSENSGVGLPDTAFADRVSEEQRQTLFKAMETRDPVAIYLAGPLLTHSTDSYSVRLGPTNLDASRHLPEVWTLVSCQFGFECGPSNSDLLASCTNDGNCSTDYAAWLRDHRLNGAEYQLVMDSAEILANAISTGDWSQVKFVDVRGRRGYITGSPRVRIR
jgi:hypothetical protein